MFAELFEVVPKIRESINPMPQKLNRRSIEQQAMEQIVRLILTTGTHFIRPKVAAQLLAAIERGEKWAKVPVDVYCDGSEPSIVTIMLTHIVAFMDETDPYALDPFPDRSNIRYLRAQ